MTKLVMQTNVNRLKGFLQSCCIAVLINIIQVSSMEGAEPVSSKKPADVSRPVATAVTRALPFLWQEGERWDRRAWLCVMSPGAVDGMEP